MEIKEGVNHNMRQRGYEARDKEEMMKVAKILHEEGYSQVKIAEILDISRGTLHRWNETMKVFNPRKPGEAGILANKKYNYDENYFSAINTPNQAYLVGYILGDGTVFDRMKSKRLVLSLAEEDKQLLEDIASEINMKEAIKFRKRNAPNEQNKYTLTISCTKMCDDLIKLGITPNKTGRECWIPFGDNQLQWSFLRGIFDADGNIRVYKRYYPDRNKTYLKTRFGITGSKQLLEGILIFLQENNIALNVNSIRQKEGCFDLHISSLNDVKTIFIHLYKHGDIRLQRKYKKFSSLMI
ncbi:helix-turn-helix domain-containing protein [Pseudalkalibacillus sp. SCS-8]|uniref:helix-turn-helix domain-containing protein n=1 Tax=Pseudalkalibacillus nanhaiensis TaxID=3115291 RepID=UPI0032DAD639